MTLYRVVLFLHILTLLVAAGVTAVTKLAVARRGRARTLGDALEWHNTLLAAARIFPLCLVAFVVTGGYMMSVLHVSVLHTGFILAGLAAVLLLLTSGTYLGVRGAGLKKAFEGMIAANGADAPVPRMTPPPLVTVLPVVNTGIALAAAFDMVLKPISVPVALGILAGGAVLGAIAAPRAPAAARTQAAAAPQS